jgi:hypothetical protein
MLPYLVLIQPTSVNTIVESAGIHIVPGQTHLKSVIFEYHTVLTYNFSG